MPRKSRIDTSGALQDIIIRGIEGKAIFRDLTDRQIRFTLQSLPCGHVAATCPPQLLAEMEARQSENGRVEVKTKPKALASAGAIRLSNAVSLNMSIMKHGSRF